MSLLAEARSWTEVPSSDMYTRDSDSNDSRSLVSPSAWGEHMLSERATPVSSGMGEGASGSATCQMSSMDGPSRWEDARAPVVLRLRQ